STCPERLRHQDSSWFISLITTKLSFSICTTMPIFIIRTLAPQSEIYYLNSMSAEKKLFLIDAMAMVYRAYYALIRSPRITSKGRNTNAQFGFTNTLYDLIRKEQPTHMAVVWDTHAPTERHTDFSDYKANRQEAPEDL